MKKFLSLILVSCALISNAQDFDNCYAIVVGRDASADGSVILGHNEDDSGEQMLNCYFTSPCTTSGKKEYGTQAAGYFWAEFPGMPVADAFMNDYGVAVVSDNCRSREDAPEITGGGVLYEIRVNVARYAHTAREAVDIIGAVVEKWGYTDKGRTYIVADCNEAWLVAVVNGKRWAASRVPDDGVAVIPNYYVNDRFNPADTANYAGSADIVSYAVSRGWYDPAKDGEFSFKNAYADDRSRVKPFNVERHIEGFRALGIETEDPFNRPFTFTPKTKLSERDIMTALSFHRDKFVVGSLSRNSTVLSTVFQMRGFLPKEIGCVCWMAVGHPGTEPFFPVYLGMTEMPSSLARYGNDWRKAEKKHFTDYRDMRARFPKHSWWKHIDHWTKVYENPESFEKEAAAKAAAMQDEIFAARAGFESEMVKLAAPADRLNRNFSEYYTKWIENF